MDMGSGSFLPVTQTRENGREIRYFEFLNLRHSYCSSQIPIAWPHSTGHRKFRILPNPKKFVYQNTLEKKQIHLG